MHYAISRRRPCKNGKSRTFLEMHFLPLLLFCWEMEVVGSLFTRYFSFPLTKVGLSLARKMHCYNAGKKVRRRKPLHDRMSACSAAIKRGRKGLPLPLFLSPSFCSKYELWPAINPFLFFFPLPLGPPSSSISPLLFSSLREGGRK